MFFEWVNEGKVWDSCTSYAIIRVITRRVMRNFGKIWKSPTSYDNSGYNCSSYAEFTVSGVF